MSSLYTQQSDPPPYTPVKPKPGELCTCCGLVVPYRQPLRAGRKHPETSHAAARVANRKADSRAARALRMLDAAGTEGMTDDEIDAATGWGSHSTTPLMNALRNSREVGWVFDGTGIAIKRTTRKGNAARVNVLAKHAKLPDQAGAAA